VFLSSVHQNWVRHVYNRHPEHRPTPRTCPEDNSCAGVVESATSLRRALGPTCTARGVYRSRSVLCVCVSNSALRGTPEQSSERIVYVCTQFSYLVYQEYTPPLTHKPATTPLASSRQLRLELVECDLHSLATRQPSAYLTNMRRVNDAAGTTVSILETERTGARCGHSCRTGRWASHGWCCLR